MAYRTAIPRLLRKVGFVVLSDEFTEIEDPDPDRHRERQRELISELDEARKELEKGDTKKRRFTFFGRGKEAAKKKDWETYEDPSSSKNGTGGPETDPEKMPDGGVLFDVDAIRAELAKSEREEMGVKELSSTLPPLKAQSHLGAPQTLRHAKSFGDAAAAGGGAGTVGGGYRAASTTRLDSYPYKGFEDDSSEDEFGNRRRKRGEEVPTLTFDEGYGGWGGNSGYGEKSGYAKSSRYGEMSLGYEEKSPAYGSQSSVYGGSQRSTGYRPELKSSSTFPASSSVAVGAAGGLAGGLAAGAVARNVWADDDDDEFAGGEGEMTMTFA